MDRGARYTVKTRYGVFSLDEESYRDCLAGKLWINWPPDRDHNQPIKQESFPVDVTTEAVTLRDSAARHGVLPVLQQFIMMPRAPYKERMQDLSIYELNLSVRASNGLMRAGIQTFKKLSELMDTGHWLMSNSAFISIPLLCGFFGLALYLLCYLDLLKAREPRAL